MLAARATTRRLARSSRHFATATEFGGIKVAASSTGQPTTSITVLLKAGSRYQPKPGVAHFLKHFGFRSTANRSTLGTIREAELYGGVLSAHLGREHLAYTAEFMKGDEEFFVDVLASLISSSKFAPWEFQETVSPAVQAEVEIASSDAVTRALELAHSCAFRNGLGSSLYSSSHPSVTVDDVKAFASSAFAKGNIAVVGTGIDTSNLTKLFSKHLKGTKDGAALTATPTKVFGGETRSDFVDGPQTIFIGYGVSSPSAELAALASHLSPKPSVKWSKGISTLASQIPEGASVNTVYLPYSDAALFGFLVQAPTTEAVKQASEAAVKSLKETAGASSLKAEEVKKAVAKAKFEAASTVESRQGFVNVFGQKLLSGSEASFDSYFSALDKVDGSSFSKTASSLLKSTPTYVAIGDIETLPYKDEIGL